MGWRRSFVAVVVSAVALSATEARADKMDDTLDISLHFRTGWIEADAIELREAAGVANDELAALGPTLTGFGPAIGASGRFGATLSGLRFGLGIGAHTVDRLHVDVDAEPGRLIGFPLELYAGYALGSPRELRGFAELRGTLHVYRVALDGDAFDGYAPGLALRGGGIMPLGEYFFLDAGAGIGLVGPEVFTLDFGLGIPIPFDNL